MKTLADFKRRIKVGQKLYGILHRKNGDIDKGIRSIGHVQSNSFAFTENNNTLSWLKFPKAKDLKLYPDNPDKFTILQNGEEISTYTFIN